MQIALNHRLALMANQRVSRLFCARSILDHINTKKKAKRRIKIFSSSNASKRSQFAEHGRDKFRNGWVNVHRPLHHRVRRLGIH
jgi:hypothetical protein